MSKTCAFGKHSAIDGYGGSYESLSSKSIVYNVITHLLEMLNMKPLSEIKIYWAEPNHLLDPGGWSAFVVIHESHIALHTFPARGFLSADIYTCQENLDQKSIIKYVTDAFNLSDIETHFLTRGTKYPVKDLDVYERFTVDPYLKEYMKDLDSENILLLDCLHEIYANYIPDSDMLIDIGTGPTIYQLISASKKVQSIISAEYLECNRDYLAQWQEKSLWDTYFEYVAELEGSPNTSRLLRKRLVETLISIVPVDLTQNFLGGHLSYQAEIVSSTFCFESISREKQQTEVYFSRLINLIKPNGYFVCAALTECNAYKVGNELFPCTYLTNDDLEQFCEIYNMDIKFFKSIQAQEDRSYGGITVFAAQNRGK